MFRIKEDLLNLLSEEGYSINQNALNIFISAEAMCYQKNISLFPSDLLFTLINNFSELTKIIDKYGGNSNLAIKQIEELPVDEERDRYSFESYSGEKFRNDKNLIINKCMKSAKENNRLEINEADITLSVLGLHDEEAPPYSNGTYTDTRFHTLYNTISHVAGYYSEHLWVKNDDVRWELNYLNKKKYDIAISFAGEDREIAEEIAEKLSESGKRVFYDNFEKANLWGKNLYAYLSEVYGQRAKYCLMIVSKSYAKKHWTNLEREAAQSKAFREKYEYILPLRLDDTEILGLLPTTGYIDIRNTNVNEIVNLIIEKITAEERLD